MVDWLVQNGHKRIGFIKGTEGLDASQERLEGYLEGLKKNNIKPENTLIAQTNLTHSENEAAMQRLLSLKKRPTAVIAFNDYVALDVIKYTRAQGLKINKDIVFVSYANLPITSYLDEPLLVSVEQFPYEQAEKATEMLIKLINSKNQADEKIEGKVVLESKLIVHELFK